MPVSPPPESPQASIRIYDNNPRALPHLHQHDFLLLHRLPAPGYPPLIQLLLQTRDLPQTPRVPNQLLHPLLLLARQLHPVRLLARARAVRAGGAAAAGGARDVEGAGFEAQDLVVRGEGVLVDGSRGREERGSGGVG